MDTPHIWTREGRIEAAKNGDVEAAYRLVAPFMNVHFMGTPTADDLRAILKDARAHQESLRTVIAAAEKCLKD